MSSFHSVEFNVGMIWWYEPSERERERAGSFWCCKMESIQFGSFHSNDRLSCLILSLVYVWLHETARSWPCLARSIIACMILFVWSLAESVYCILHNMSCSESMSHSYRNTGIWNKHLFCPSFLHKYNQISFLVTFCSSFSTCHQVTNTMTSSGCEVASLIMSLTNDNDN